MELYWRGALWVGEGDGIWINWGPTVLGHGWPHNLFSREVIFEQYRREHFPDRPSRLASTFAFPDLEVATTWGDATTRPMIYRVELEDPESLTATLDLQWFDRVVQTHTIDDVEMCARAYWDGTPSGEHPIWEVLVAGTLRVIERVGDVRFMD